MFYSQFAFPLLHKSQLIVFLNVCMNLMHILTAILFYAWAIHMFQEFQYNDIVMECFTVQDNVLENTNTKKVWYDI